MENVWLITLIAGILSIEQGIVLSEFVCELNVKYGSNCDKMCNARHCAVTSSSCNVQTGDCESGRCQPGWKGNDCTMDVNECLVPSTCDINAGCTNTIGSYTCRCKQGYTGTGHSCTDVNECNGQHRCDVNADCTNSIGSYTCSCRSGFTGDGYTCTDINEQGKCDENGDCTNIVGSYVCPCKKEQTFTAHEEKTTDTMTIVLVTTNVISFLLFISFIIIILLVLRKQSKTTKPAVQFSDIKNSNERAGRSEQLSRNISTNQIISREN